MRRCRRAALPPRQGAAATPPRGAAAGCSTFTKDHTAAETQKIVVIGKELSDNFDAHDDEWSDSVHLEEPVEEASEKIEDLESRMEEASARIKEKDSRILELEALSCTRAWRSAIQSTNLLFLQPDLHQLLQEKMEAEIQCIILTRASQTWTPLSEDQTVLYEEQKALSEDYKQLELKLRHAENRAMSLGETAEKLEMQCKELSASSEILQLQSRASVSLFCFIQFILRSSWLLILLGYQRTLFAAGVVCSVQFRYLDLLGLLCDQLIMFMSQQMVTFLSMSWKVLCTSLVHTHFPDYMGLLMIDLYV